MAVAKKIKSKQMEVTDKVKDYGNDPFFVKKAKDSKVFLEEHGFPKEATSGPFRIAKATTKRKVSI
jgi:hypothetical protein